jgi:hypothetical protein
MLTERLRPRESPVGVAAEKIKSIAKVESNGAHPLVFWRKKRKKDFPDEEKK